MRLFPSVSLRPVVPLGGPPPVQVRSLRMTNAEENLIAWASQRPRYGITGRWTMLDSLSSRTGDYPEVKARIVQHLLETRRKAEALEKCIKRRGGETSTLKDLAAKIVAFGQGISGMFVEDEIVKGAMASYTYDTWRRRPTAR